MIVRRIIVGGVGWNKATNCELVTYMLAPGDHWPV